MKRNLLHKLLTMAVAIGIVNSVNAKIWRVNNTIGSGANFTQVTDAAASSSVAAGDTLYVEGSPDTYYSLDLKKRLVIIGPGYFLSGNRSNTGLQYNGYPVDITVFIDSTASGTVIMGLSGTIYLYPSTDNVTLSRNKSNIYNYGVKAGAKVSNLKVTQNYCALGLSALSLENAEITSNIIISGCQLASTENTNCLFRNNVIDIYNPSITGFYVSNNIFLSVSATFVNCTIKYNLSNANNLPAGNNNKNSVVMTTVFTGTGSIDGAYQLLANSPATGAGEPINGITPDCGAFGTADPYRLSGIPPIPTIYQLSVPASVPSSATTMTVTLSTRSNN